MEKIHTQKAKDAVSDLLRAEILSGNLPEGREITQEELAEQLQVSRMPVREALQTLEMEGLVMKLKNRHIRIIRAKEEEIRRILKLLAVIAAELLLSAKLAGASCRPLQEALSGCKGPQGAYAFFESIGLMTDSFYLRRLYEGMLKVYPRYLIESGPNRDLTAHFTQLVSAYHSGIKETLQAAAEACFQGLMPEEGVKEA